MKLQFKITTLKDGRVCCNEEQEDGIQSHTLLQDQEDRGVFSSRIPPQRILRFREDNKKFSNRMVDQRKHKLKRLYEVNFLFYCTFFPFFHSVPFHFIPFPSLTSSFYEGKIIKARVGDGKKNQKSQKNIHPCRKIEEIGNGESPNLKHLHTIQDRLKSAWSKYKASHKGFLTFVIEDLIEIRA